MNDLIPVSHNMKAANSASIAIDRAVLLRLEGQSSEGKKYSASVMTYISPDAKSFYSSKEELMQLGVMPKDFPRLGGAVADQEVGGVCCLRCLGEIELIECGCLKRKSPPPKPTDSPLPATQKNVPRMKEWLLKRCASSWFNKWPHQVLPEMARPPIAKPVCLRSPATVPLHWTCKKQAPSFFLSFLSLTFELGKGSSWRVHQIVLLYDDLQETWWGTKTNSWFIHPLWINSV